MGSRQFILEDGRTANVPEESIATWMERMDKRGVKFRDADADTDAFSEMTVGEPEVIKSEKPLGRTLNMAEVEAEAGPAWMRGLSQEGQDAITRARDTVHGNALFSPVSPDESAPTVDQAARALALGYGDGFTGGAAKVAGQVGTATGHPGVEEFVAPLREQDAAAQAETPRLYAGANFLGAMSNPISRGISALAAGKGFLANVAAQGLDGAIQGFTRTYGDTGDVEQAARAAGTDAFASGLMSVPTATASAAGTRLRTKAELPRNQALRAEEYNAERLRSAGVGSGQIDNLPPEELAQAVALIEDMQHQGGGRPLTVPEMGYELRQYTDRHGAAKDEAFKELSAAGATVDPNDMAFQLRQQKNRFSDDPSLRESVKARGTLEDMASGYDAPPAIAYDEITPVEAYPELAYPQPQGAQPPPLPQRAAAVPPPLPKAPGPAPAPAMPAAPPARPSARAQSQVMNIAPEDLTPVRPSARAQPQPPPAPVEADPIGALAAQNAPIPDDIAMLLEQDMLPHLEQTPGAMSPDELIEMELAQQLERQPNMQPAPRPSARYAPPPTDDGQLMGNEVAGSGRVSARYKPPPAQPPDPVGALAAAGGPANMNAGGSPIPPPEYQADWSGQQPWTAADQAAQPRVAGTPPPLPPTQPPLEEFVRGVPGQPDSFTIPRAGVPIADFMPEKTLIGEAAGNALTPPEAANQFRDPQYAASVHAIENGMAEIDPMRAGDWSGHNRSQGLGLMLQQEAAKTKNLQTPGLLHYPDNRAAMIGGAFGAGVGSLVAPGLGTGVGAAVGGAIGKGIGYAANRYTEPRAHAIKADWLSGDTAAKAARLESVGRFPVGSLTASFGDLMREPPPEPESNESDPNGETSSLDPGSFLGRNTTQAMISNPQTFMAYADDYARAGTDDRRAAVTERLYRTDPRFARDVFPTIQGGSEVA